MYDINHESWIWTELLAFDCTQPDCGVGIYISNIGYVPYGISLLLAHQDFILLHKGMDTEYELFPDVCSRRGHDYNEERKRQRWTNFQLFRLIKELQEHGIKVFVNIFIEYLRNQFHHEWSADHPNIGFLNRMEDGKTLFEDLFVEKLKETVFDYAFAGWHAADAQCPAMPINYGSYIDDDIFSQFAEHIGKERVDARYLQRFDTPNMEINRERMPYVWHNFKYEWMDFISSRWESLHKKATAMLHGMGKEIMLNSCFTKSVFESMFYFGLDPRRLAEIGIDYFLVESVATSMALLSGDKGELFNYASCMAELKTVLPNVKLIMLSGMKDVVESYNAIRHAPNRLERDFYFIANQTIAGNSGDKRCADGFMICLGDGISENEWKVLAKIRDLTYSFEIAETDGFVWLSDNAVFDAMRTDHERHGTLPPYLKIAQLLMRGNEISCVCMSEDLDKVNDRPLVVPSYDLIAEELKEKILARKKLTVLIGNFHRVNIPECAASLFCRLSDEYDLGCVLLNGASSERIVLEPAVPEKPFDSYAPSYYFCPHTHVPVRFWDAAATLLQSELWGGTHLLNADEQMFAMTHKKSDGIKRTVICSAKGSYAKPNFRFDEPVPSRIKRISEFPCHPLDVMDGKLTCKGNSDVYGQLHIPPFGLFAFDSY